MDPDRSEPSPGRDEIESTASESTASELDEHESSNRSRPRVVDTVQGKRKMPPALVIAAGVVLTVLTVICLQVDDWSRDWTHNSSETNPDSTDVNMRPIESTLNPSDFADLVIKAMENVDRWDVKGRTDEGQEIVRVNLIHRTFFVGFKDDVEVEIVKSRKGSTLYAKSQSRIGKGDLGQNPRNIKELISKVNEKLDQN